MRLWKTHKLSELVIIVQASTCGEHTSFFFRKGFKHALEGVRQLSLLESVDQVGACGEHTSFSFERVSSMRLMECASFLFSSVDRAGAFGEHTSFSFEKASSMRLWCARFLVSSVFQARARGGMSSLLI